MLKGPKVECYTITQVLVRKILPEYRKNVSVKTSSWCQCYYWHNFVRVSLNVDSVNRLNSLNRLNGPRSKSMASQKGALVGPWVSRRSLWSNVNFINVPCDRHQTQRLAQPGTSPTGGRGGGGRGCKDLRTFENRGGRPPQKFTYFSIFFLETYTMFCIFPNFQNKVAEIRGETKFWE